VLWGATLHRLRRSHKDGVLWYRPLRCDVLLVGTLVDERQWWAGAKRHCDGRSLGDSRVERSEGGERQQLSLRGDCCFA